MHLQAISQDVQTNLACNIHSTIPLSKSIPHLPGDNLQCVFIINCLPQTLQTAICPLVCLPHTWWSGGKTWLFQAMLCRQYRWADLQWLSNIYHRFDPLTTQFIPVKCLTVYPMMAASWSSTVTSYRCLRWILDNVVHSYKLSFLQDWWRGNATLYITAGHNILRYADTASSMP